MANEIRATANLQITQNGFTITGNSTQTLSLTGSNYKGEVLTISSSYVAIPTGSLNDLRYVFLYNQSTASLYVALNTASQSFATLQWGDVLLLPPSAQVGQLYIKGSEAACDYQLVVVES